MKTIPEMMVAAMGRANRAHAESQNMGLPKDQRDFHAGRREAYLQMVALIAGSEVREIRADVLGRKGAEESVKRPNHPTRVTVSSRWPNFE